MSESERVRVRPFVPTASGWTRRVRSLDIGRGQRHCAGCGRYLRLAWTGELCRCCQEKAMPGECDDRAL